MKCSRAPGAHEPEAYFPQPVDLGGIGHLAGRADGGDAPAGPPGQVQLIRLERDHGAAGGGGELAAAVGPDHDVTVVEGEVDQLHRGQRPPGVDDPAHRHRCHQHEAFVAGQLLEG